MKSCILHTIDTLTVDLKPETLHFHNTNLPTFHLKPQTPCISAAHVIMSKNTRGEQLLALQAQPLVPESGTSSRPLLAQPDQGTEVEPERFTEKQASSPKSTRSPVPQTSSARSNLSVAVVPSRSIEGDGLTKSQASTLNLINEAGNPIPQPSPTQRNHSVAVVPPPTPDSREIEFSPAKPSFRGYVSESKELPQYIGGYSDVRRCRVRFSAPSEVLPREVSPPAVVPTS